MKYITAGQRYYFKIFGLFGLLGTILGCYAYGPLHECVVSILSALCVVVVVELRSQNCAQQPKAPNDLEAGGLTCGDALQDRWAIFKP